MLNYNLIRDRITMVAEPGIFTAQAVQDVIKEAERHGNECRLERQHEPVPKIQDIRKDLLEVQAIVHGWRTRKC